jgi:tRNA(Ile)-lysidine synthase
MPTFTDESRPYAKPGETGGTLIRRIIAFLRENSLNLPLSTHILIASSSGSDSTALAHLIAKYGRRVVAPDQITLLHIHHGWRGEASDGDEEFVRALAARLGVGFEAHRLEPPRSADGSLNPAYADGRSWEDAARSLRKEVFRRRAAETGGLVFTGHHMDDLAETVLWRLLTGVASTHGGGIAVRHGVEVRPLLTTRKKELLEYLLEEGETWRSDETNEQERFLRARMRQKLLPEMEAIFPKAIENLAQLGLDAQARSAHLGTEDADDSFAPELRLGATGFRGGPSSGG